MASSKCNRSSQRRQSSETGYGFLAAVLDGIDCAALLDSLQRTARRPCYPVGAMWRAWISRNFLGICSRELVELLRGSAEFRRVCGFSTDVPSQSTFGRFGKRLTDYQSLVDGCLAGVTQEVRDRFPPLREVLAEGPLVFPSDSSPSRQTVSDPNPEWSPKNRVRTEDREKEWDSGFKADATGRVQHTKPQDKPKNSAKDSPEPRVVAIDCKPAPDADDRLRRVFARLLRHPAGDREPQPGTESSPDQG